MKINRRISYTVMQFDDLDVGDVFEVVSDGRLYMKVQPASGWNAVDLINNDLAEIRNEVAVRPFFDATLEIVDEE